MLAVALQPGEVLVHLRVAAKGARQCAESQQTHKKHSAKTPFETAPERHTGSMITTRTKAAFAGIALIAAATLAGCASGPIGGDVLPPVMETANDLQGATVELPMNQVLSIDTGDLDTNSYTAEIADPAIVEFTQGTQGATSSDLTTNPGFKPLKEGTTEVTMTNAQGGIQPLTFTIVVVAK